MEFSELPKVVLEFLQSWGYKILQSHLDKVPEILQL
jgi:hypothetical protein